MLLRTLFRPKHAQEHCAMVLLGRNCSKSVFCPPPTVTFTRQQTTQTPDTAELQYLMNELSNSKFPYLHCHVPEIVEVCQRDMLVQENFITEEEEQMLFKEVEPKLKRHLRYEYDHWDDAIHGYREIERSDWSEQSQPILRRVRRLAFPPGVPQVHLVHVLDLAKDGWIKPHVDSVKFAGNTIAGLSLLSPCVMRLVHNDNKAWIADVLLKPRSLYIMRDAMRYDYTHEILKTEESKFCGEEVPRDRRISVICRNEPAEQTTD
ncbi:ALKBH7 [Branchiostoma lanceolatum]|uniref:ALKBH7 protein n=1 Tax=Branchiostoma lanceolatum TaxID=7740 RepID=A0A8J9YVW7_BRALA|nr:ALKBH7 [Branchiostoma lanceolatum]